MELIKKLLTPSPEKLLKPLYKMADAIDALEPEYEKLTGKDLSYDVENVECPNACGNSSTRISLKDIPGICYRENGEWVVNPKVVETPADLPVPDRTYFYKNKQHQSL